MAPKMYPKAATALEKGQIDLATDPLEWVLVDASYVQSDAHEFLSDVPAGSRVTSVALAGVTVGTVSEGTLDANDPTTAAAAAGDTITAAVLVDTVGGADATNRLIAYVDEDQAGNPISFPTNGSTITLNLDPAGILTVA